MHRAVFMRIIIIFGAQFRVKLVESYQKIARRFFFFILYFVSSLSMWVLLFLIVIVVVVSICKSPHLPFSRREGHCQVLPNSTMFPSPSERR